jgi:hypothetical protein
MAELSEMAAGDFCTGMTDPFMIDGGNNIKPVGVTGGTGGKWDVVGVVSI